MIKAPTSLLDLATNPNLYGVPTFEQFCTDHDKWVDSIDKMLASIDTSTQVFRNSVVKQEYIVRGRKVDSLEEVTKIAYNEGINLMACEICPTVLPYYNDNMKYVISIEFKEKLIWTPDQVL